MPVMMSDCRRRSAVKAVGLQEEGVDDFLGLIQGNAAGLQIGLQERPGVLVKAAEGVGRIAGFQGQEELIQYGRLASFPEGASGILRNPHQAVAHFH